VIVTNGKSPARKGLHRRPFSMIPIKNNVRAQKVSPIAVGLVRFRIEQNLDRSTKNNFSRSHSFPIIERRKGIYVLERGSNLELRLEIIARNPGERYDYKSGACEVKPTRTDVLKSNFRFHMNFPSYKGEEVWIFSKSPQISHCS
jgi:hypothetical protein